jgi:hypothetical protein
MGILLLGKGTGADPALPTPLYSPGNDAYDHRYVASRFGAPDGTLVTSWPDQRGTLDAPRVDSGNPGTVTVLSENGGPQFLRIASADNQSGASNSSLRVPTNLTAPRTVAAIVRKSTTSDNAIEIGGYAITRAGNQQWQLKGISGGYQLVNAPNNAAWVFVLAVLNVTTPVFRVGAQERTVMDSGTMQPSTPINGNSVLRSGTSVTDMVELFTWPSELNAIDRSTAYFAAQAAYPTLGL